MSAAWWFGIAIAVLLILFIAVVGASITVERGMSAAQWIVLVIIGLPTLFIAGVGAVLTYVRVTTHGAVRARGAAHGYPARGHPDR